jgi:hypothetical protein
MGVSFPVARKSWVSFPDDFQLLPSHSLLLAQFFFDEEKMVVLNRDRRFWGKYEGEGLPGLIMPLFVCGELSSGFTLLRRNKRDAFADGKKRKR